jgi:site-specific DNA-methyltransferase (adenine-specific)
MSNGKNTVIIGDNLQILKQFEDECVDLIITSPPYFQQRDYGNGQFGIGNETTENDYLQNLLKVFDECVRVTKKTGSIVFNLGDKYLNGNLALLPYKFAIKANENSGVFLINQLTWTKLNPTPRQEKRKLIQATEPFFIFAKSKDYYFNLESYLSHLDEFNKNGKSKPSENLGKKYFELIENSDLNENEKVKAKHELKEVISLIHKGEIVGFRMKIRGIHKLAYGGQEGGRNNQIKNNGFTVIKILGNRMKKDVIESPVEITKDNHHPAVYPSYIIQELIKLLSKKGDTVLDPFCGSGTTCLAAKTLERQFIGIEINPEYVNLANQRLKQTSAQQEYFI